MDPRIVEEKSMRTTSRYASRLVVSVAMLAALVGPLAFGLRSADRTAAASLAGDPKTLVVGRQIDDAKWLDPGRYYEFTAEDMARNVYEMLVTYHGSNVSKAQPELASSWKVSGGGKVYTFQLRHNVRFSNGDPMTSADVVFSYRRLGYLNDQPAFLMGATGTPPNITIYNVQAVGKYGVRFTLPAPDASFIAQLATPNFAVMDAKVLRAHGGDDTPDASTKDKATDWLNGHSAGTGPFVISNWVRGASGQIVLKRNTHYWGKAPYLNSIVYRGIQNATTQRLQVSRGTVDVAINIDIDGANTLRKDSGVKVVTGNTLDLMYMGMTLNPDISKPLSNPVVRQAVRYAIDYNGIIRGLLRNVGTQPNSMIPVGLIGNDKATNNKLKIKTNVAKAKALLKQAGYGSGFDVPLAYPAGVIFRGIPFDLVAPKIQQDLAKVGIRVTLQPQDEAVLLASYRAQKVPFILFEWGVDYPDSGDFAGPFSPGGGPAKRMWYTQSSQMGNLVDRAIAAPNLAKRKALYIQIEKIWLKESPWIGLVQPRNIIVLHKGVTNYTYSPEYHNDFRYVRKS